MQNKDLEEIKNILIDGFKNINYRKIVIASIYAVLAGTVIGMITFIFGSGLLMITEFRQEHNYLVFGLPFAGFLIVLLYQTFDKDKNQGMGSILQYANDDSNLVKEKTNLSLILAPLIFITTWLTHLFGGSAGREGVAVQVGAITSNVFGKKLSNYLNQKELIMIGMAAGFGGLFQTPIAAAFFALEITGREKKNWNILYASLIASFMAMKTSSILGLEKFIKILPKGYHLTFGDYLKILLCAFIFGFVGYLFTRLLKIVKTKLQNKVKNQLILIFVGGIVLAILLYFTNDGRYMGLGTNIINVSFEGGTIYGYDWLLKLLLTIFTISLGFQGGEVTPLFAIGSSLGIVLALSLGLPVLLIAALGYVAVFSTATNTFWTGIFLSLEVFGFTYFPIFIIVVLIAKLLSFRKSIYS